MERSGFTKIPKLALTGRNLAATNQIAVSASGHRKTNLRLCGAHYCPPVATSTAQPKYAWQRIAGETKASILEAGRELGYPFMKQEQVDVARAFLERKDVFAVLPTGFGKSLCYACLPAACDILMKKERGYSIVVVITPLIAIMTDQVKCSCFLQ